MKKKRIKEIRGKGSKGKKDGTGLGPFYFLRATLETRDHQ